MPIKLLLAFSTFLNTIKIEQKKRKNKRQRDKFTSQPSRICNLVAGTRILKLTDFRTYINCSILSSLNWMHPRYEVQIQVLPCILLYLHSWLLELNFDDGWCSTRTQDRTIRNGQGLQECQKPTNKCVEGDWLNCRILTLREQDWTTQHYNEVHIIMRHHCSLRNKEAQLKNCSNICGLARNAVGRCDSPTKQVISSGTPPLGKFPAQTEELTEL